MWKTRTGIFYFDSNIPTDIGKNRAAEKNVVVCENEEKKLLSKMFWILKERGKPFQLLMGTSYLISVVKKNHILHQKFLLEISRNFSQEVAWKMILLKANGVPY
jgi:hypothetical protein